MYAKIEIGIEESDFYLDAGEVVYTTSHPNDRGVGKTRTIIAMALESGKPIIVENRAQKKAIEESAFPEKIDVYALTNESMRGYRFPDGVLVDDISEFDYKMLRDKTLVGTNITGFVRES